MQGEILWRTYYKCVWRRSNDFGTANRFLSFFCHFNFARNDSIEWTWFSFPINNWHKLIDIIAYLPSQSAYSYKKKVSIHFLSFFALELPNLFILLSCDFVRVREFAFNEHSNNFIHGNRTRMRLQSHTFYISYAHPQFLVENLLFLKFISHCTVIYT